MAYKPITDQERLAQREANRERRSRDWERIKGWWGRLPRTGSTVADDISAYKPSGSIIDSQRESQARRQAARQAAAAERRRRREVAESATGDGVADDIRQAAPMWQRGRGAVHERPAAGPPTGVGGVISPGLSSRARNVPTGAGDFPVYKGAPAQNFRTAFAAARKSGKKTFTWQGRKYTTDVA